MQDQNETARARWGMVLAMCIFGTIGVCRKFIPLPSGAVAMARGLVGAAFLLALTVLRRQKLSFIYLYRCGWRLLLAGVLLGVNWILLFEAYTYTSVATATLCYYMAPVIVMLASPLLGERMTAKKCACIAAALIGMVLVSGVLEPGAGQAGFTGVLLGLGAAALYAAIVLLNKTMPPLPGYDKTVVQLLITGVVLLPYVLLTGQLEGVRMDALGLVLLLVVCVLHTGVAYALYFGNLEKLPAQTAAILSYLDPVVAVLLSALVLREPMSPLGAAGAALIIGAMVYSELTPRAKKQNEAGGK